MKKFCCFLGVVALAAIGCKEEIPSPEMTDQLSSVGSHVGNDIWQKKADASNIGRAEAIAFSIGNKGYIGTGMTSFGSFRTLKDFWEYDPNSDVWTQKADVGGLARRQAVGFSIGGRGYVGTGFAGSIFNSTATNDFWQYSPGTNSWEQKASVPGGGRAGAVGFGIASKGYIGTGSPTDFVYLKDFYEYDPATDSWSRRADFEGAGRAGAVSFSIAGKGYIGTGVGEDGGASSRFFQDFWEFNPSADTWTSIASLPVAKVAAVGFSILNHGYVGTGGTENAEKDFYTYNPISNLWTRIADFGGGERVDAVSFSIGPKGYVGTGFLPSASPEDQKDFWEYQP